MRRVYRIESSVGSGMYYAGNAQWILDSEDTYEKHPSPKRDSLLAPILIKKGLYCEVFDNLICDEYKFGFDSIEQLRRWIYEDRWLVALHEHEMMIAEYELPDEDVLVGHTQVMFKRQDKYDKEQFNILHYFNLEETTLG